MSATPINVPVIVPGSARWWQVRYQRDARRRPRAEGLTIDRITAASLAILDEEGLEALTMRRLADDLGSAAASLYRHVANRDELLVEIVDHVLGEVGELPPGIDAWQDGAQWLAHELYRVLCRHPSVVRLVPGDPLLGPNAMRGREVSLRFLLDHGFGEKDAIQVYAIVVSWILGYLVLSRGEQPDSGQRATAFRHVPSDRFPTIRDLSRVGPPGDDELFRLGLLTLLAGIEQRYGPPAPGADGPLA
jgi:AcrR family transcriptional regulator